MGVPAAGSPAGTTGCRCAGSAPGPACRARLSYPTPAGFPESGWWGPVVWPALPCGSERPGSERDLCLSPAAPPLAAAPALPDPGAGVPAGGCLLPAAPGPSPADGAAGAPSSELRGPEGQHCPRLSPAASSPPSPGWAATPDPHVLLGLGEGAAGADKGSGGGLRYGTLHVPELTGYRCAGPRGLLGERLLAG